MKVLVDELPTQTECPYSYWKPLPPCCEETGYYICKLYNCGCHISDNECLYFKVLNN